MRRPMFPQELATGVGARVHSDRHSALWLIAASQLISGASTTLADDLVPEQPEEMLELLMLCGSSAPPVMMFFVLPCFRSCAMQVGDLKITPQKRHSQSLLSRGPVATSVAS